jgi:hypothetical protein
MGSTRRLSRARSEKRSRSCRSPLMLDDKLEIIMAILNVLSICGSLRKGSFNAMVQRLLPSLAPDCMTIKLAPCVYRKPHPL